MMSAPPFARRVLRAEYTLLRTPVRVLIEGPLLTRLRGDSPLRLTVERGLGSLDVTAGRLLGDSELNGRGQALQRRADLVEQAAELAEEAERLRGQAKAKQAEVTAARGQRVQAQQDKRDRVAQALVAEQQHKHEAEELAQASAAQMSRQADLRAKRRIEELETQRQAKATQLTQRTAKATGPAKKALARAAQDKSAAAKRRTDATKLATLAAREKKNRP